MNTLRNTTAAGLLALGAALSSSACVDNDSSLFVVGVFNLSSTQCLAEPDSNAVLMPQGVLDRAFTRSYRAALLVGSHLTERGSREKLRTETSRLQIEGAHIEIFGTTGGKSSFDSPATGLTHPASGTDPSLAAVFAQFIRPEDMGNPNNPDDYGVLGPPGQIIVRVSVFGTTLGGQEIESGEYDFPILVCDGCLVTYPADAAVPNLDPSMPREYECSIDVDTAQESTICSLGQDDMIPCTLCASYNDVCRFPSQNPWLNGDN
jgi:hypothetical protein